VLNSLPLFTQFSEQVREEDSDSDVSLPSQPFVSVTYLWLHPLFDLLKLRPKPEQKVFITNDFEHWDTGSLVQEIPSHIDLDEADQGPICIVPW